MTKEAQTLKCCPFCGRNIIVACVGGGWFWKHVDYDHKLIDANCPIRFSHKYNTEQEAIDAWNTRYEEPNKPKEAIKPLLIISKENP